MRHSLMLISDTKKNKKMLRAIYFKYFVSYLCPSLRFCLHILTEIEIMMPSLVGYRFLDVPINSWEGLSLIIAMRTISNVTFE